MRKDILTAVLVLTLFSELATVSGAEDLGVVRGRTFARVHCTQCHSIDRYTNSPLAVAPPFRDLHKRYDVGDLAEAFAEGILTGHPSMPQFELDPVEIADLIAFMRSLEH